MGEIIFSLFVWGYLATVGLFMNWYLRREERRVSGKGNKLPGEEL